MPEGDTIFRAARRMNAALAGQKITKFESVLPHLTRIDQNAPLAGRTVEEVAASGKHLLIRFSGNLFLRTHMRMKGSWHLYRPGEAWRRRRGDMRIMIATETFIAVGFSIPVAEFLDSKQIDRQMDLRKLGPDALSASFDPEAAAKRIQARPQMEIADAILNQRVVGGLGNVLKSEVLFCCGINPFSKVQQLSDENLRRIASEAQRLIRMNVKEDGDQLPSDKMRGTTGRLNPRERLWVYGRSGSGCLKCGTTVNYRKQGIDARSTYWCSTCQPQK